MRAAVLAVGGIEPEREPHLRPRVVQVEVGRRDAHDGGRLPVDLDRATDDAGVAREATRPQLVREHGDGLRVRQVLGVGKRAASRHARAEHAEHVGRDERGVHALRSRPVAQIHGAGRVGGDVAE